SIRVSKLFWLNGPDPDPIKLLKTPLLVGCGNSAKPAPACGEILPIGIRLPANGRRPAPVLSPVPGSYTCPPPATPAVRYWLRLQNPGVELDALVAGLHDCRTVAVGIVNWLVMPLVCLVPWKSPKKNNLSL